MRASGFDLDTFTRLAEGSEAVATGSYQAMLLDHRLQDGCTVAWLRKRRACGLPTPAMVLTPTDCEEDRIQAYFASGQLYAKPERSEPFL